MKLKKEYIILLAVIIGLSFYLFTRQTNRTLYELPRLTKVPAKKISKIEISGSEGKIVLKKEDESWLIGPEEYPASKNKIRQMIETIEMMKLMFTEEKVSYEGKYFEIKDALCKPGPVQKPFPIVIGGRGEKTLSAAAKYADHIDIYSGMDVEAFHERYSHIENVCSEIGRDFKEITFSWGCWFWIFENEKERVRYAGEIKRLADYGDQFQAVMGTPEEILEKFEALKEAGATYFTLRFEDLPSKRGLRLCAEHIMNEI